MRICGTVADTFDHVACHGAGVNGACGARLPTVRANGLPASATARSLQQTEHAALMRHKGFEPGDAPLDALVAHDAGAVPSVLAIARRVGLIAPHMTIAGVHVWFPCAML